MEIVLAKQMLLRVPSTPRLSFGPLSSQHMAHQQCHQEPMLSPQEGALQGCCCPGHGHVPDVPVPYVLDPKFHTTTVILAGLSASHHPSPLGNTEEHGF